jgi:hypothetical protein
MIKHSGNKRRTGMRTLAISLCSAGILCPVLYTITDSDSLFLRSCLYSLSALLISLCVIISLRFIFTSYEFAFYGENDRPKNIFAIAKESFGKREVVFSVAVSDIREVFEKKEFKKHKKAYTLCFCWDYRSDLFAKTYYIIYEENKMLCLCKADMGIHIANALKDQVKDCDDKKSHLLS